MHSIIPIESVQISCKIFSDRISEVVKHALRGVFMKEDQYFLMKILKDELNYFQLSCFYFNRKENNRMTKVNRSHSLIAVNNNDHNQRFF